MFERDRAFAEIAVDGEVLRKELHHLLIKARQVLLMQSNANEGGDDAFGDGLDIDAVLGIASLVVALKHERAVANQQHTQKRREGVRNVAIYLRQDG